MVKKYFCDRCEQEIDKESDDFEDMFNQVSSSFREEIKVINPQLCLICEIGYNKIIKETNKNIKDYLKRKRKK